MAENRCAVLVVGILLFINHLLFKCCLDTLKGMVFSPENNCRNTHLFQLRFPLHKAHLGWVAFYRAVCTYKGSIRNVEIEGTYPCKLLKGESARPGILSMVL